MRSSMRLGSAVILLMAWLATSCGREYSCPQEQFIDSCLASRQIAWTSAAVPITSSSKHTVLKCSSISKLRPGLVRVLRLKPRRYFDAWF
jgi:hypothetical protein